MQRLLRLLGIFLLVFSVASSWSWADEVSIVKDAAVRTRLTERAQKQLSGIIPGQDKGKRTSTGTAESTPEIEAGQYILWGELFEKGRIQAIVELNSEPDTPTHLALADWDAKGKAWTVRQVIRVPVFWRPPGIPDSEWAGMPENMPARAFWVKQLAPSAPRLLMVSTFHSRYRGGRFIFSYDAALHELDAADVLFSVEEPELRSGHVVLTYDSGRKAHWSEDTFYQVEKGRLKFRGSLREGSYNGDDTHIHVGFVKPGSPEEVTWRFNATAGDGSTFKIHAGEVRPAEGEDPVIGSVRFLDTTSSTSEEQGAYLLHKLTGLPAAIANARPFVTPDAQATPSPPTDRDVEVTGNAEVMQLLGPSPKPPPKAAK